MHAGIKKSFENLKEHLQEKYSSIIYDLHSYNSKKLRNIESFCNKETLQILIIGIQSFNKDNNGTVASLIIFYFICHFWMIKLLSCANASNTILPIFSLILFQLC